MSPASSPANAGRWRGAEIRAVTRHRDEDGEITYDKVQLRQISGMAPSCKLVSLKVLDENGDGEASNLIAAIEHSSRSTATAAACASTA